LRQKQEATKVGTRMTGNTPQGTGQIDRAGLINRERSKTGRWILREGTEKKDGWSDKQKLECRNDTKKQDEDKCTIILRVDVCFMQYVMVSQIT